MFNVAILGCENTHANDFLQIIKDGKFTELNVIGVYSEETETANSLKEKFGVPVMENYADLVGKVDAIMVTARHGDNHYKYAMPYLSSGIPMFIDKPITCQTEQAIEFMQQAKKYGVKLCGGSSLKGAELVKELKEQVNNGSFGKIKTANVYAPVQLDRVHGGFYFYAQHLVEIMTTIFGEKVTEVFATKTDLAVNVIAKYSDFNVTLNFLQHTYSYGIALFGEKEFKVSPITFTAEIFSEELKDTLDLLKGGEMKKSYGSFINPVFIMSAILKSIESGKWEKIEKVEI